jgi:hypothetical protein
MSHETKVPVEQFAAQCASQMVPLNNSISYFAALPLKEDDLRRLLFDPVTAAPPSVFQTIPKLRIVLAPYLEKAGPRENTEEPVDAPMPQNNSRGSKADGKTFELMSYERPAQNRRLLSAVTEVGDETFLFLGVKDEEVADYHYTFYVNVAELLARRADAAALGRFYDLLISELKSNTHGEIDEKSWRMKEQLIRRQSDPNRDTKLRQSYFRQAIEDTLTLYLHGLCCDIDVDTGPRQLASRHIRRRLQLLRELWPPPAGFALFPEELQESRR